MRKLLTLSTLALLTAAACVAVEKTTGAPDESSISGPLASAAGAAMADLIVRDDILSQQWVVRDENLPANFCSVIEGGVTPGVRRLIRFTVMTPNIGDADINIGDPNKYFTNGQSDLYEFASCHGHYHFKHYALYELVDKNGRVWQAAKRGFCMLDTDPNPAYYGQPPKEHQFRSCGSTSHAGNQGISSGWADTYRFTLGGQYFILDGGDGQAVVPPGDYFIRITVNPPYAPSKKGGCPRAQDPATGMCHQFEESNYANNQTVVAVTIPSHPGREGYGPLAGSEVPKTEPFDDENRPTNSKS